LTEKEEELDAVYTELQTVRSEAKTLESKCTTQGEESTVETKPPESVQNDPSLFSNVWGSDKNDQSISNVTDAALQEKGDELNHAKKELHAARAELDVLRSEITQIKECAVEKDTLFADVWGDDSDSYHDTPRFQGTALSASEQQHGELCAGSTNPFDVSSEDEIDEDQREVIQELRARVTELERLNKELSQAIERMEEEQGPCDEIAMFRERADEIEIKGERELSVTPSYGVNGQSIYTAEIDPSTSEDSTTGLYTQLEEIKVETATDSKAMSSLPNTLDEKDRLYRETLHVLENTKDELEREREDMAQVIETLKNHIQVLEDSYADLDKELLETREEAAAAAAMHTNNSEAITSLKKILEEKDGLHKEKLDDLENQMIEMYQKKEATVEAIKTLENQNKALEERCTEINAQLLESKGEAAVAAATHESGSETISSLQRTLDEKDRLHKETLRDWKNQIIEMDQEKEAMARTIETLKDHNQGWEQSYTELNAQLVESREEIAIAATMHKNGSERTSSLQKILDEKDRLHKETLDDWKNQIIEMNQEKQTMTQVIETLNKQIQVREQSYTELNAQLVESREGAAVAATMHKNGSETTSSLQKTLDEKDRLHKETLDDWKNQILEMNQEKEAMTQVIETLKNQIQAWEKSNTDLNTQLVESREEAAVDSTTVSSLQKTLDEKDGLHNEELGNWENQVLKLQKCNDALKEELLNREIPLAVSSQDSVPQTKEATDGVEYVALLEDSLSVKLSKNSSPLNQDEQDEHIASLEGHIQTLEEYNEELTAQLAESEAKVIEARRIHDIDQERTNSLQKSLDLSQSRVIVCGQDQAKQDEHITSLEDHIQTMENYSEELTVQLAESEAKVIEATRMHEHDQERTNSLQKSLDLYQSRTTEAEQARVKEQATIISLQNNLAEKEKVLQSLSDQHKLHLSDLSTWKSKVVDLKQSNEALIFEMRELVTENETECNNKMLLMDLQNSLNTTKEREIQHNLHLAKVKADFHNATNLLEELRKENQKLKGDIESLKGSEDANTNRNFEKEMNAAHSRFVSMEKALENKVSRLEKDKLELQSTFNAKMTSKEEAHAATMIELSAWKLEMQNALNDIQALKKERDELAAQVQLL